jgi:hypothetical protein
MRLRLDPTSIGPVDVAVIGFTDHAFRPELAGPLRELVDAGTVRIIDLAFAAGRFPHDGSCGPAFEVTGEDMKAVAVFPGPREVKVIEKDVSPDLRA